MRTYLFVIAVLTVLCSSSVYCQNLKSTQIQIRTLLNDPAIASAHVGVHIENLETGEIVYSQNPYKLFLPASNLKVVTTACALSLLGPDYQYETKLYTDGKIDNGILQGNLYIRGCGDPTINEHHYEEKSHVFRSWANTLKQMGIRKVQGQVIGDVTVFGNAEIGYGWEKDDLIYYYGAKTSSLTFNDNCIDLVISPASEVGKLAIVTQKPLPDYLKTHNHVTTSVKDSSRSLKYMRDSAFAGLKVSGQMPVGADAKIFSTAVPNPADFFLANVLQTFNKQGIHCEKYTISQAVDYTNKKPLFTHKSPPLRDIIKIINKQSNNLYAETVWKTMGLEIGGSRNNVVEVEKKFLEKLGIAAEDIFIVDGSGLSRHNMIAPQQMIQILKYMHRSPHAQVFRDSLAIGGKDGTLRNRWRNNEAAGSIFGKSGYLTRVITLCGYVYSKAGGKYAFSIMVNNYKTRNVAIRNIQDQITTILYHSN
ncbi:D-alanyl-D-alanine carboxypeptidase/D-alanyl-D-alanine endopeptidase [Candidatus Uabimicrobium amorphum]|uniref:Peptidase M15 n=1 Tax=Uabimicrobium amorphum TaxID=2596890 RepID=A0A5S9IRT9_UABAM|nr:D-alanyl-D-alanine carboxypeptidase/D-alanyl-D-alanine-endopeptidase [Candidatus Uabimicrobium amorphum]BBM86547.1 peptidase M15 [Candidatus Uabimicrobium amorphum]